MNLPVKFSCSEDKSRRHSEIIRVEIDFSPEISINREYLPTMEESVKKKLTERLQRYLYGDIEAALIYAERDLRAIRPVDLPMVIDTIFRRLKTSIPKLTHE